VHVLLPWQTARYVLDVVGAYGLIWLLGIIAAERVHPHLVTRPGIRVRNGFTLDIPVPWDVVRRVELRKRYVQGTGTVQVDGTAALVTVLSQTNVAILFREPMPLPVGVAADPLTELHLYADDPDGFVAAAEQSTAAR
jgi:hypothetical protein